jgi:hypothetical protein
MLSVDPERLILANFYCARLQPEPPRFVEPFGGAKNAILEIIDVLVRQLVGEALKDVASQKPPDVYGIKKAQLDKHLACPSDQDVPLA